MLRFCARSGHETENCVSDLRARRRHCSKSTWLFIRFVTGGIAIGISRQILHIKARRSGWNKFPEFRHSIEPVRCSASQTSMYVYVCTCVCLCAVYASRQNRKIIYIRSSQSLHVHAPFIYLFYLRIRCLPHQYFVDEWLNGTYEILFPILKSDIRSNIRWNIRSMHKLC